ncbi:MAG: hypothetical protein ABSA42_07895 [Terracidiphilus sp.]
MAAAPLAGCQFTVSENGVECSSVPVVALTVMIHVAAANGAI